MVMLVRKKGSRARMRTRMMLLRRRKSRRMVTWQTLVTPDIQAGS